jgi:carbon starvation protein CstA
MSVKRTGESMVQSVELEFGEEGGLVRGFSYIYISALLTVTLALAHSERLFRTSSELVTWRNTTH